MYGLDRACIYIDVQTDILYVRERVKIIFPHSFSESLSNHTNNYKIDKKNINYIKLEEKKIKRLTTIKIDFSYPRFFSDDNIYPLSDETRKIIVENNLVKLINSLIDYEITAEAVISGEVLFKSLNTEINNCCIFIPFSNYNFSYIVCWRLPYLWYNTLTSVTNASLFKSGIPPITRISLVSPMYNGKNVNSL